MVAINIREIARLANVSVATVSRVLNTPELVQIDTRERVLQTIQRTGYAPRRNGAARDSAPRVLLFLLDLMEKNLAPHITWDPFDGGLFAWCHLPAGVDMQAFVQKALEKKVCVVPGTAFLTDENEPCDAFRINFSTPTDEQLQKGIELLGEAVREML